MMLINLFFAFLCLTFAFIHRLPSTLRDSSLSLRVFKGRLKTYLFGGWQ